MNPSVILTCTSYHKAELPNNGIFRLGPGGGSIGRNPSCDVVLPDPQKVISGCHAKIVASGADVLVVDESTNGLFVDGAQSPLGRGSSIPLRDGMQLGLGEFLFSVALERVAANGPQDTAGPGYSAPAAVNTDFGNPNFDPLADIAPVQHPSMGGLPDGAAAPLNPIDPGSPPQHAQQTSDPFFDPLAQQEIGQAGNNGLGIVDTLAEQGASSDLDHGDPLSDPFSAPAAELDGSLGDGLSGHASGGDSIIPEDWMSDEPVAEPQAQPSAMAAPGHTLQGTTNSIPQEAGNLHPEFPAEPPSPAPAAADTGVASQKPPHAPEPPHPAPDVPTPTTGAGTADSSPMATQTNADATPLADSDFEEMVLKGLMDLLAARANLKNELRMSATLIRQAENNPLKFAANVAAAKVLFTEASKNNAYLSRTEAVTQAMSEIQEHQMALLIGMRAAFNQLLKTFSPENFEDKQGAGIGKIVSSPEKKAWVAYKKFYTDRVTQSDDPFQDLFSVALSKAYLSALDSD